MVDPRKTQRGRPLSASGRFLSRGCALERHFPEQSPGTWAQASALSLMKPAVHARPHDKKPEFVRDLLKKGGTGKTGVLKLPTVSVLQLTQEDPDWVKPLKPMKQIGFSRIGICNSLQRPRLIPLRPDGHSVPSTIWPTMVAAAPSQPFRLAPTAPFRTSNGLPVASGFPGPSFWGRHGFDGIDCGMGGMSGCGHP